MHAVELWHVDLSNRDAVDAHFFSILTDLVGHCCNPASRS